MVSTAARIGGVLGAAAAFAMAMVRGGLSAWTAGALTAGALVLVAVVLFTPSETPARRLGQLIQAWRIHSHRSSHPARARAALRVSVPSCPRRQMTAPPVLRDASGWSTHSSPLPGTLWSLAHRPS